MNETIDVLPCTIMASAIGNFNFNPVFPRAVPGVGHFPRKWKTNLQPNLETRASKDVLITFLSTVIDSDDIVEKMRDASITYNDLASLTLEDLEFLGVADRQRCCELLSILARLPNQQLTYQKIYQLREAQGYNSVIFDQANDHLNNMSNVLHAANCKLRSVAPTDTIVGDKSFASRFVLETLSELNGAADNVEHELNELAMIIDDDQQAQSNIKKSVSSKKTGSTSMRKTLIVFSLTTGALAVFWYWKMRK